MTHPFEPERNTILSDEQVAVIRENVAGLGKSERGLAFGQLLVFVRAFLAELLRDVDLMRMEEQADKTDEERFMQTAMR